MRLLVVSDLHFASAQYEWLVDVAPDFDAVIIAGDQLDVVSPVTIDAQISAIGGYIARLQKSTRVIVCSGNHDLDSDVAGERRARWVQRLPDVLHDGQSTTIDGMLVSVCGWWDGPVVRSAIDAQLKRDALATRKSWAWVFHAPPSQSPTSWSGSQSFGDADLAQWISAYQPDMVFTGHVHQAPFASGGSWVDRIGRTWVFNAGHQFGAPPAHIVVDTDQGTARWSSAAGTRMIDLRRRMDRAALVRDPA